MSEAEPRRSEPDVPRGRIARVVEALRGIVRAPHYSDEQDRRAAALANAVLWVCAVGPLVYGLLTLHLPVPWTARLPVLVAAAVPAVGLWALRRGWLRATSLALCTTFWLVPLWGAVTSGGVRAPAVTTLFLTVVLAGQLLGMIAALVTAGLSVIAVIALVQLGARGMLPPPQILHSDGAFGVAVALELVALGAFCAFAARLVHTMLGRLRAEQAAQQALEAQLEDARRLEYIGRLAGGIAHDFNNALTVILANAHAGLGPRPLPADQQRELLEEIREAGERASQLTRQLLTFARRQRIEPRTVDLGQCLRDMTSFLRRLLPANIELAVEAGTGLTVNADPAQLEQLVVNLVGNARDAMPDGGHLLVATREERLDPGHARSPLVAGLYAVLAVRDDGTGMDDETRARVFEPFFTTKPAGQGTGLGLATVWSVASQGSGHVFVASRPGQGSTFEVYLPRVSGVPTAEGATAPPSLAGAETVLVVDDQVQVRQVVARALERHGYRVVLASNASEAARLCEPPGPRPRLLLSDLVMPGDSGPALARRLREANPHLAVLFMSGYAEEAMGDARAIEGAAFIQKPFAPDALLAKVRDLLNRED
jgi:two-component system cell cycle sensor histidine kinase/response regulator CckA